MIHVLIEKIDQQWSRWVRHRAGSRSAQKLDERTLYIFPSGFGWAYAMVLFSLFLCAINYQVSSVFFLTFLLAVAGLISALEAHFNLKGVSIQGFTIEDAYLGGVVKVVLLINIEGRLRYDLYAQFSHQEGVWKEKVGVDDSTLVLLLPASKRGCFQLPRITLSSYFPLGLFRVWGYVYVDSTYYVYPASVSPGFWPSPADHPGKSVLTTQGVDEFFDLKQVADPWVQSSRIAWKIAARGQGWFLKTMVNTEGRSWIFHLQDLPPKSIEENLQHLCYWLQHAEQNGYFYGIELNNEKSRVSQGPDHLKHCLRQLAIY